MLYFRLAFEYDPLNLPRFVATMEALAVCMETLFNEND